MLRRRYIIWIGLCAVVAPLLVNLGMQYASLVELQQAAPVARRVSWEHRLQGVVERIQTFYTARAAEALAIPPDAIVKDRMDDDVESYFKDAPSEGVKRYFITSLYGPRPEIVKVTMYDPVGRVKVNERTPNHWSAFAASSSFFSLILDDKPVDPAKLVFGEDDPENRIIARPITDASSRVVGVAGMIVDDSWYRSEFLPSALPQALRASFSEAELNEITFAVLDENGQIVTCNQPCSTIVPDVSVPLQLSFSKWRLAANPHGSTTEAIARRNFELNFSLTLLNAAALVLGIGFALRAASKEMKISQMKSDFVSNVSHELRTPLSSIRVLGEFMRSGREIEPEKLRKYGEYIETESQRLAKLINNILDFSKIESGQRAYHRQPCHMEDIVSEALRVFEVRLVQRGFTIDVDAPERPLPAISVDRDAIAQALSNLLDNAIKYSGQSRRVGVRIGSDDRYVFVSVTDQGIGIPKDEQEKIFERFHRVSTGLVHDVKGSGLGLSLVRHIVEAHGGRVTVASEVGRGSTFTLKFPAANNVGEGEAVPPGATDFPEPEVLR